MTLQEAADLLGLPKKKLWRAVKAENLKATQKQVGNRWEYRVSRNDLESYRKTYLESSEDFEAVSESPSGTTRNDLERQLLEVQNRSMELENAYSRSVRERARLERENQRLSEAIESSRNEAKAATLYLKEARTLIKGWEARRRRNSFWQRLVVND